MFLQEGGKRKVEHKVLIVAMEKRTAQAKDVVVYILHTFYRRRKSL
jgi:hypothetical protein